MDDALIDKIYEAAAIPELWTGVLDDIAQLAGGIGGAFLVPRSGQWMATPGIEEMMADLMTTGLINANERTRRLLSLTPVGFYRDLDIFDLEDLPSEPVYRDFFIPRGGGFGTATVIESPSGDSMILHVERALSRGLVEAEAVCRLDALRPHLARASLLSARLALEQARSTVAALDQVGLAAAVLDRRGRMVAANPSLDAMVPDVVQDRASRFTLVDPAADALLADAFGVGVGRASRSIPIAAQADRPANIVHLLPVRGSMNDIFTSAASIVVVTPVVPREVPTATVVQGLFDLTPAEARVARAVAEGKATDDIAAAFGIRAETVRSQIKAVLGKTGVHRKTDLVRLLQGAALPKA